MRPSEIISELNKLDFKLSHSGNPSRSDTIQNLYKILIATDKSLALTIRDAMVSEIVRMMPDEFGGELHDTNPGGKGFLVGYVSFALDPQSWESNGIIGGILFKLKYDAKEYKSHAPEGGYKENEQHPNPEATINLEAEAGYYNKKIDGSYSEGRPLGDILVQLDAKENFVSVAIDEEKFKSGISSLINEILENPPEYAQSFKRRKMTEKEKFAPTSNVKALHRWLLTQEQGKSSVVWGSQLNNLAQGRAAERGTNFQSELKDSTDYFSKRGWKIDHKK